MSSPEFGNSCSGNKVAGMGKVYTASETAAPSCRRDRPAEFMVCGSERGTLEITLKGRGSSARKPTATPSAGFNSGTCLDNKSQRREDKEEEAFVSSRLCVNLLTDNFRRNST